MTEKFVHLRSRQTSFILMESGDYYELASVGFSIPDASPIVKRSKGNLLLRKRDLSYLKPLKMNKLYFRASSALMDAYKQRFIPCSFTSEYGALIAKRDERCLVGEVWVPHKFFAEVNGTGYSEQDMPVTSIRV